MSLWPSRAVGQEYFHVTRDLPYNKNAKLVVGSNFEMGAAYNPYFGFYEGIRAYPVVTDDGEVAVPAIKFLKSVSNGSISCSIHPQIAAEIAEHYVMLCRELIMEEVRREIVPEAPSRQKCLWVAEDLNGARQWHSRLGGLGQIVRLRASGTMHRADAAHLLGDSEPLTTTYSRARAYWRGEISSEPQLEILLSGLATVVEVLI